MFSRQVCGQEEDIGLAPENRFWQAVGAGSADLGLAEVETQWGAPTGIGSYPARHSLQRAGGKWETSKDGRVVATWSSPGPVLDAQALVPPSRVAIREALGCQDESRNCGIRPPGHSSQLSNMYLRAGA